jgi:ABC-type antimicrobial peptide transport system permease subunit
LIVGIPFGVLVGDAIWRAIAHSLGVRVALALPPGLVLLVPAVIVAVNVIAFFPARTAARLRPAVA